MASPIWEYHASNTLLPGNIIGNNEGHLRIDRQWRDGGGALVDIYIVCRLFTVIL